MWFAILGILIGITAGYFLPLQIPVELARYTAVAILGILDSILGAIKADLQKEYEPAIFLSGLFFNMALAVAITYLGDRLSLDLYIAVLVVFTLRMFANIATIRYAFLTRFLGKKRVAEEIKEE